MSEHTPSASARPNALSLSDAAKLLSKIGGRLVTVEMLQKDIDAGALVNPDGTINLIHYAAWLARECDANI